MGETLLGVWCGVGGCFPQACSTAWTEEEAWLGDQFWAQGERQKHLTGGFPLPPSPVLGSPQLGVWWQDSPHPFLS